MAGGVGLSALAAILQPEAPTPSPFSIVYYGALPLAVLALIHSLDRTASRALRSLRPRLDIDDTEVARTHHRLTIVPARPALVIAMLSAFAFTPVGYVLDPVGSGIVGYSAGGLLFRWAWESFVTSVSLVLVYHTIRQLRIIGGVHERLGRIDVFDQEPLYALSWLTSRTAVGLILLPVPSVFLIPTGAAVSYILISAAWYGLALAMATAAFFLPLRGMHDRLADEKRRLHAAVDSGDGPAVEASNCALATLIAERDLVNRIPTWPWSTGALTGFVSAVLLPIGLWIATRVLGRFV